MIPMKKSKQGGKGCLFLIVGTLAVIVGTILFAVVTGKVTELVINARHGGEAVYALMTASIPCIVITFLLLNCILILLYLPGENPQDKNRTGEKQFTPMLGEKPKTPSIGNKRVISWAVAGMAVAVIAVGAVSANTYTLVSAEDGITTHCFVDLRHYGWDEVGRYNIDCDNSKGLSVTFTMKDGKKIEILQGTVSATKEFHASYREMSKDDDPAGIGATLAYAVDIDKRLSEQGVLRDVSHFERAVSFYQGNDAMWPYVSELIGYGELFPIEDTETAETTDVATAAEAETTKP